MSEEPPSDETLAEIERLAEMLRPLDVRTDFIRAAGRSAANEHAARQALRRLRELLMEQGIKE